MLKKKKLKRGGWGFNQNTLMSLEYNPVFNQITQGFDRIPIYHFPATHTYILKKRINLESKLKL